ncbi:type A2 lanthipeptide [Paenibacillus hubeiensis]|uniref:type A2 lanthipeptide n=1 Tax=Paenibacillus hubeiensis TaxID=3077330 RepID=UPI0031BBBFF9
MKELNFEALGAIEDISDDELMVITGAVAAIEAAKSGGVFCTVSHECHYNSVSPSSWLTCC